MYVYTYVNVILFLNIYYGMKVVINKIYKIKIDIFIMVFNNLGRRLNSKNR